MHNLMKNIKKNYNQKIDHNIVCDFSTRFKKLIKKYIWFSKISINAQSYI